MDGQPAPGPGDWAQGRGGWLDPRGRHRDRGGRPGGTQPSPGISQGHVGDFFASGGMGWAGVQDATGPLVHPSGTAITAVKEVKRKQATWVILSLWVSLGGCSAVVARSRIGGNFSVLAGDPSQRSAATVSEPPGRS
jgi:hypothetical protein